VDGHPAGGLADDESALFSVLVDDFDALSFEALELWGKESF
jgi:hypothetical protein